MNREHLQELVTTLGREFARRGMKAHVESMRVYWVALANDVVKGPRFVLDVKVNADHVVDWLGTLRLPPYEKMYPVRKRGEPCFRCKPNPAGSLTRVESQFPGGHKAECGDCGAKWLVLEK